MRAIQISEWGGPEVLELVEDAPVPEPGEGQVLIRVTRAGINFADTHARENSYLARYELPLIPGAEVAGVVERDGAGLRAGSAWSRWSAPAATRSTSRPTRRRLPDPRGRRRRDGAGAAAPGPHRVAPVPDLGALAEGESVVVHAAAGGVGSLAVQLGQPLGAGRVIATAPRPRTSASWRSRWAPTRRSTSAPRTSRAR